MTYYYKEGVAEMKAKRMLKHSDEIINTTRELRLTGMSFSKIEKHFADIGISVVGASLGARINYLDWRATTESKNGYETDIQKMDRTENMYQKQYNSILYNSILSYVA